MAIVPEPPQDQASCDLSYLVVSPHFGAAGDCIQVRDARRDHELIDSYPLDVASVISLALHGSTKPATIELAERLDRAIAEAVFAFVSRVGQVAR